MFWKIDRYKCVQTKPVYMISAHHKKEQHFLHFYFCLCFIHSSSWHVAPAILELWAEDVFSLFTWFSVVCPQLNERTHEFFLPKEAKKKHQTCDFHPKAKDFIKHSLSQSGNMVALTPFPATPTHIGHSDRTGHCCLFIGGAAVPRHPSIHDGSGGDRSVGEDVSWHRQASARWLRRHGGHPTVRCTAASAAAQGFPTGTKGEEAFGEGKVSEGSMRVVGWADVRFRHKPTVKLSWSSLEAQVPHVYWFTTSWHQLSVLRTFRLLKLIYFLFCIQQLFICIRLLKFWSIP